MSDARFIAMNDIAQSLDWGPWRASSNPAGLTSKDVFRCVWAGTGDIDNGGFAQFFTNSTGDRTVDIIHALRQIGAAKAADLLDQAQKTIFGGDTPSSRDEREAVLEQSSEKVEAILYELEQRFYEPAHSDEIIEKLFRFAEQNGLCAGQVSA